MTAPDLINGAFEMGGGVMVGAHVRELWRDKMVRGVSIPATVCMTAWGLWNLYFYPHLGQWVSFVGGVVMVVANATWVTLMIYYSRGAKG